MSPLDIALAAILGVSVLLSVIVLATLALILEAVLFGLGHGRGGDKYDGR
jgi:hypothetical protein